MFLLIRNHLNIQNRSNIIANGCRCFNNYGDILISPDSLNLPSVLHAHISTHLFLRGVKCALSSNCFPLLTTNSFNACNKFNYVLCNSFNSNRYFSSNTVLYVDPSKSSSKIKETDGTLKKESKTQDSVQEEEKTDEVIIKKSIKQKIIDELVHYYHGFRLLFIDINVSAKLVWRILRGEQLSRRERNLLVRTISDMFRLVPFSVFIIVPFMELLLPVFIKLFPDMLPSTFQTTKDKDKKMKQSLKVKLEMAKFLQGTLNNMTSKSEDNSSIEAKDFTEFFEKVRSDGGVCTSEEIMKFSKLFEDEITLDSLPRPQLVALCRVLELKPVGTSNFLRFQLRMKLRRLAADDLEIQEEGIDTLTLSELQEGCRSRGMRAYGLSPERLRFQLTQWLDLSLNKKVPPSLLLLSRAFMLPETIPTTDKLKATISALPETVAISTKAAISKREGIVDNKTEIEIIKEEQRKIQEEKNEIDEEIRSTKKVENENLKREAELLVDEASELADNADDLEPEILLNRAEKTKQTIADVKKKLEKAVSTKPAVTKLEEEADNKTETEMSDEEQRKIQEEKNDIDEEIRQATEVQNENLKHETELLVDRASKLVDKACRSGTKNPMQQS